jgi:monoamine oxidase
MPRSPLGFFVQQMTRNARAQRAAGSGSTGAGIDRRTLLVGGVGLGIAGALAGPASASEDKQSEDQADSAAQRRPGERRVVIIGAGLAGLTCAYELRKQGIVAEVWEASNRLGGRCLSDRSTFAPLVIERGGELIDTGHVAMTGLVAELGLQLNDLTAASGTATASFFFDGQPYTIADATRDFAGVVYDNVQADAEASGYPVTYVTANDAARALDSISTREWINTRVPGGVRSKLGRLLDIAYTIEYGLPTSQQSCLTMLSLLSDTTQEEFTEFGASDERYRVRGGNDLVVSELAARLPNQIVTNTALTGIKKTSAGDYKLKIRKDGRQRTEFATHVVLALPFSVLRDQVDTEKAGFRPLKQRAIRELRYGQNSKLHVETTGRPWEEIGIDGDTYADTGYQATWDSSRAQEGPKGVIVNFTGADVALTFENGPADRFARRFARQFEPVVPGFTQRQTGRSRVDAWSTNPYVNGSYAAWKVGQVTSWAGVEGEPEGRVFFCGEHTSIENQGYLEGAVETGQRAAQEVIQ